MQLQSRAPPPYHTVYSLKRCVQLAMKHWKNIFIGRYIFMVNERKTARNSIRYGTVVTSATRESYIAWLRVLK